MFTSVPKFALSEGIVQNRYLSVAYQIWYLYTGEWDRNPPLVYEIMFSQPILGTAGFSTPFHQRVSIVSIGGSGLKRVLLKRIPAVRA